MSTPQLEDGFVRIANELLEAILSGGFSLHEQSVLLAVVRKTYGYGKKEDDMSAAQIGALCGVARQHVTSALNALASRNVISKRQGRFGMIIGIQKDHRKSISKAQLRAEFTSPESGHGSPESGLVQNMDIGSPESGQVDSPESGHTKDNLPKDNHQKKSSCAPTPSAEKTGSTSEASAKAANQPMRRQSDALQARFERFYEAYPKKRARRDAENAFVKIKPDDVMVDMMLEAIERFKASGEWSDPQFIPYPASWLNANRWTDVVQTTYDAAEVEVIEAFNAALGDQLGAVSLTPFIADRAAAIRDFRTFSPKPGFVQRFFPWVREHATFPPNVGFDWVIGRQGYANLTSGQHSRKAA